MPQTTLAAIDLLLESVNSSIEKNMSLYLDNVTRHRASSEPHHVSGRARYSRYKDCLKRLVTAKADLKILAETLPD